MARQGVIGRLPVTYDPARRRFTAENSAEFVEKQIFQKLDDLAHEKPLRLVVTFEQERKGRTLNQNRMMWALLTIMADAYNAGRAGGVSPEDCYFSMLEEYGLEYDFLELPVAALPILRNAYRLVHVVELLEDDRCTAKASMGSSSFTTAQMAAFIDGIFDRLAEMGVNDPNVTAYWQQWQEVPRWKKRKS